MSEFSIIDQYCAKLGVEHGDTVLAVGDDAAIVSVPEGYELAVSVDTMNEGTHFFKGLSPELLAHKILAVNLSDMAAMGARPRWATLAMSLPEVDMAWVERFFTTLSDVAKKYGVQIIGGDTTEGHRSLTMTVMGLLPKGKSMTRSGAKVGDKVYCSGTLGDAALALTKLHGEQELSDDVFKQVLSALHMPVPQVTLGQRLLGQVSSCIDVSDGLIGDSAHIANKSKVTLEIEVDKLPLSDAYRQYMDRGGFLRYAIAGGDDYQLLFTADESKEEMFSVIEKEFGISITKIGRVTDRKDEPVTLLSEGKPTNVKYKAYQHFS